MNYNKHYERLIARARGRVLLGYSERHHVIPRCMGGSNGAENIVRLTPEEHYVAHRLLAHMHPGVSGLVVAVVMMAKKGRSSKAYGWLRRKHTELSRGNQHAKGYRFTPAQLAHRSTVTRGRPKRRGYKHSLEACQRKAERQRGKGSRPDAAIASVRGVAKSEEHRAKLAAALLGRTNGPHSPATRAKMSLRKMGNTGRQGQPHKEKTKALIAERARLRWANPEWRSALMGSSDRDRP